MVKFIKPITESRNNNILTRKWVKKELLLKQAGMGQHGVGNTLCMAVLGIEGSNTCNP